MHRFPGKAAAIVGLASGYQLPRISRVLPAPAENIYPIYAEIGDFSTLSAVNNPLSEFKEY